MTLKAQGLLGTQQKLNTAAQTSSFTQDQGLLELHQPSFAMGMAWASGAPQATLPLSLSVYTSQWA